MPLSIVSTFDKNEGRAREVSTSEGRTLAESCGASFYEYENNSTRESAVINQCIQELLIRVTRQKSGASDTKKHLTDSQQRTEFEVVSF